MKVHLKKCQFVTPEIHKLAADSDKIPKLVMPTGIAATPLNHAMQVASSSSLLLGLPNPSPLLIASRQLSPLPGFSSMSPNVPLPSVDSTGTVPDWPPATKRQRLNSDALWTKEIRDEFQHDLCLAFVSSRLPWNAISDVQLRHFLVKWIPGAEIPDRRKLAGPILDEEVK